MEGSETHLEIPAFAIVEVRGLYRVNSYIPNSGNDLIDALGRAFRTLGNEFDLSSFPPYRDFRVSRGIDCKSVPRPAGLFMNF